MKRIVVPLAVYAVIVAVIVLIGWMVGSWYFALGAILVVTVVAQLVWRNWWGDRRLLKRDTERL